MKYYSFNLILEIHLIHSFSSFLKECKFNKKIQNIYFFISYNKNFVVMKIKNLGETFCIIPITLILNYVKHFNIYKI